MSLKQDYHYIVEEKYDKKLKTNEYSSLLYLSKRKIQKEYPKAGFILVGGIGKGLKNEQGKLFVEGKEHIYYTLHYSKLLYGIDGYISIGEDKYIAVIGKRRLRNLMISLLIACFIGLLVAGGMWLYQDSGIDESAIDYTPPEQLNIQIDPGHIALPGYKDILMNANTNTAYMALWNPPTNPCYFQFTIVKKENGEEVYKSKLIPPGKAVTEIKFNEVIKAGKYPIQIKINTFSLDDKEVPLNGGVSEATLVAVGN